MKLLYALFICVLLAGCGVVNQQPTMTPTSTATLTPQPNFTATAKANAIATQNQRVEESRATLTQAAVPTVTEAARVDGILAQIASGAKVVQGLDISNATKVFGPRSNSLMQKSDKYVELFSPGVSVKNFVATITFINPYDTATTGNWDYGIFFRDNNDVQYRLVILSNQTWTLIDSKARSYVNSSSSSDLTTRKDEENTIWLIVIDDKAYLFINGVYNTTLPISNEVKGDVMPATGIYYGNSKNKKATEYRDFVIWSLP